MFWFYATTVTIKQSKVGCDKDALAEATDDSLAEATGFVGANHVWAQGARTGIDPL